MPYIVYRYYGDRKVVRSLNSTAKRWVDHLENRARTPNSLGRRFFGNLGEMENYILDTGYDWGEWLRPGESPEHNVFHQIFVGNPAIPTAFFCHSSRTASEIARILVEDDDSACYNKLADLMRTAWQAGFVRYSASSPGTIRIGCDKQDGYVRALSFGLLQPEHVSPAVNRLVELIEKAGYHLGTGFMSTVLLLPPLPLTGAPMWPTGCSSRIPSPADSGSSKGGRPRSGRPRSGMIPRGRPITRTTSTRSGLLRSGWRNRWLGWCLRSLGFAEFGKRPLLGAEARLRLRPGTCHLASQIFLEDGCPFWRGSLGDRSSYRSEC